MLLQESVLFVQGACPQVKRAVHLAARRRSRCEEENRHRCMLDHYSRFDVLHHS